MKKLFLLTCLILFLVNGCASGQTFETPTQKITAVSSFTETVDVPLPSSPDGEIHVTSTPVMNTPLLESQLKSQCLDIKPSLTGNVTSSGIVLLNNLYDPNNSGTFTLDMTTNKFSNTTKQGERQINQVVSPDKTLLAYKRILFDADNRIIQDDIIIANANGQIVKTTPVEKEWNDILGWSDNQHLFIGFAKAGPAEKAGKKSNPILIFDPLRNDERQILHPDFPQFLNAPSTTLPYWHGWNGVIYDSTLAEAIYPGFVDGDGEMYTYILWDISSKKVVASLKNIFRAYVLQNSQYPMPTWAPDNSQFVVRGLVPQPDKVIMELYSVSRDGVIKQLTHLDSTAYIFGSNLSWSPDGRYIAMFLGPAYGADSQKAHVAILDMKSLDITDYCFSVSYSEEGHYSEGNAPAAIWSPNSKQFLVQDWYEKNHSRVILVDIEKGIAAQIAENMEAVGWMLSESK